MELLDPSARVNRLLGDLFPFHLVIELGDEPIIAGAGQSLRRWMKAPLLGKRFLETFRVLRPTEVPFDEASLATAKGSVFILDSIHLKAQLRGQVALLGHHLAVFLGSPVLTDATSFERLGLSAQDFAPHDVTLDLVVLQMVSQMQLEDLQDRASELDEALKDRDHFSHSAATDPLTGVSNRRAFWERCRAVLDNNKRLSLLFIDVDNFKFVNDVYGHSTGDSVLRAIAEALASAVRPGDLVGRLGGDEFAVLLVEVDDDATEAIIDRVMRTARRPMQVDNQTISVSVSIGVVSSTAGKSVDDLVKDADVAMYEGRTLGRGRVTWFAERMRTDREEQRLLAADLEAAVEAGDIDAVYQPIVRLGDRTVVALEVLARWTHPTRGAVSPAVFIELAERSGLIGTMDRLAIDRSLMALARWRQDLAPDLGLQVNVSGRSIGPDLAERMSAAVDAAGVPPSAVTVEVTESWLIQNEKEVAAVLDDLAAIGTRIHLDDFGTGYSSLAHIHALPITGLKIDRSFVGKSAESEKSRRLIAATIGMARSLELDVVAEGVETEEVAALLKGLGCELGQGYLFARPSSEADITALLAAGGVTGQPVDNS